MAQTSPSAAAHPGIQRSATLPTSLQRNNDASSGTKEGATARVGPEILFSHPGVKIVSFSASMVARKALNASTPEVAGTISWTSIVEKLEAAGPLQLYRVPGSVCFLNSGDLLLSLLPKSQCWCVDGVSKFAMMIRMLIYRIELPSETAEDKKRIEEFISVLKNVLQYEKDACPFKRDFSVPTAQKSSPSTPRRTQIPAAEDTSPTLRRSRGSVQRAKKWEFDEVWRPEGYVKETPSPNPQMPMEESDGDNSSQGFEEGTFSRKTSTTSRTDTEPSSPVRPFRLDKSRSVTAPPGFFERSLPTNDALVNGNADEVADRRRNPSESSSTHSSLGDQQAPADLEQGNPTAKSKTLCNRETVAESSAEQSSIPEQPEKADELAESALESRRFSETTTSESPVSERTGSDSHNQGDNLSAVSSIQSFYTINSTISTSSFHTIPPSPPSPEHHISHTPANILTYKTYADESLPSQSYSEVPPNKEVPPSPTTPRAPQLLSSPTFLEHHDSDKTVVSPNVTASVAPSSPPIRTSSPPASPPTVVRSRHSPTLRPIPERARTPPHSRHPYYSSRRPSTPSTDLTSALVSKTCAILLGPPSGLVAIMMQIAARIASGALRGSQAFRIKDGKLGYIPGRWESSEDGDDEESQDQPVETKNEDDVSSESDLFSDEDDYGVALGSDSPARARRRNWGVGIDEGRDID